MTQTCACVARFVQTPSDDAQVDLIDRFAWYVAKDGIQFESAIMAEEAANAGTRFKFLQDLQSPEGIYYRWRVASLVMGDTLEAWRTQPFRITVDGPWWVPPPGGGKSCVQQPGAGLFLCCASPQCAPPVFTAVPPPHCAGNQALVDTGVAAAVPIVALAGTCRRPLRVGPCVGAACSSPRTPAPPELSAAAAAAAVATAAAGMVLAARTRGMEVGEPLGSARVTVSAA